MPLITLSSRFCKAANRGAFFYVPPPFPHCALPFSRPVHPAASGGGCSLSSGSGEIPAEETQPRPVPDSAMEEELQDLRRRVEFLENRLAPGKPVTPRPPAKSAPARPKSAPASKAAAPAPTPSAPAVPASSPDVPPAGTGKPGARLLPTLPPPRLKTESPSPLPPLFPL